MVDLKTERLNFRLWKETDFETFTDFFSEIENARYVGGIKSREDAWRLMASYLGHYYLKGYSYLAIEERSSNRLAGCVGLWNSEPWPEIELGYWLIKKMQGYGYASEAARKVKEYAFKVLGVDTLVSYIDPENQASVKLAMDLGAVYENDIELLDFGLHGVYRYYKL